MNDPAPSVRIWAVFKYPTNMTDKDKKLIAKAEELGYTQWDKAFDMAEQADTEEAREKLRRIAITLHHREEYSAGCL